MNNNILAFKKSFQRWWNMCGKELLFLSLLFDGLFLLEGFQSATFIVLAIILLFVILVKMTKPIRFIPPQSIFVSKDLLLPVNAITEYAMYGVSCILFMMILSLGILISYFMKGSLFMQQPFNYEYILGMGLSYCWMNLMLFTFILVDAQANFSSSLVSVCFYFFWTLLRTHYNFLETILFLLKFTGIIFVGVCLYTWYKYTYKIKHKRSTSQIVMNFRGRNQRVFTLLKMPLNEESPSYKEATYGVGVLLITIVLFPSIQNSLSLISWLMVFSFALFICLINAFMFYAFRRQTYLQVIPIASSEIYQAVLNRVLLWGFGIILLVSLPLLLFYTDLNTIQSLSFFQVATLLFFFLSFVTFFIGLTSAIERSRYRDLYYTGLGLGYFCFAAVLIIIFKFYTIHLLTMNILSIFAIIIGLYLIYKAKYSTNHMNYI